MFQCFNVTKAILGRLFLSAHVILCVWRVVEDLGNDLYWLLLLLLIPFWTEAVVMIVRRQGAEFLKFSPCIFFYLLALLPGIWLLELHKSAQFREGLDQPDSNSTQDVPPSIQEVNPATWIVIIEELMPHVVVLGRWALPRGQMSRDQLSEILFGISGMAADIMEFFSLFGEDEVRSSVTLGFVVLAIWTFAVFQITINITVTEESRVVQEDNMLIERSEEEIEGIKLRNQLIAILCIIFMQDLPFMVLRLYTIVTFNLVNYSLIFFTTKNILIIILLMYQVFAICMTYYFPSEKEKAKDEEDQEMPERADVEQEKNGLRQRRRVRKDNSMGSREGAFHDTGHFDDETNSLKQHTANVRPSLTHVDSASNGSSRSGKISEAGHSTVPFGHSPALSARSDHSTATAHRSKQDKSNTSSQYDQFSSARETSPNVPPSTNLDDPAQKSALGEWSDNMSALSQPGSREDNVFNWINDENPSNDETEDSSDEGVSDKSFRSDRTEVSHIPSFRSLREVEDSSPDIHQENVDGMASQAAKENPVASREVDGRRKNIISTPRQAAKPGEPGFKPYISIVKV